MSDDQADRNTEAVAETKRIIASAVGCMNNIRTPFRESIISWGPCDYETGVKLALTHWFHHKEQLVRRMYLMETRSWGDATPPDLLKIETPCDAKRVDLRKLCGLLIAFPLGVSPIVIPDDDASTVRLAGVRATLPLDGLTGRSLFFLLVSLEMAIERVGKIASADSVFFVERGADPNDDPEPEET